MTDPGLNQRLRQRSRRSGLMIGFSMLLTLMVCVASFTMIYARLEPVVADFVGRGDIEVPTPIPTEEPVAEAPEPTTEPEQTESEGEATTEETPAPADEETPPDEGGDNQIEEIDNENPDGFTPDYQIQADGPVNLRPGPGLAYGDAIVALPVATPLMFMGEQSETEDPARDQMESGQVWMLFQTEDGTEGWVRELDISEYEP